MSWITDNIVDDIWVSELESLPSKLLNKPKMAYSRDALLENCKRQERDKTRVRLERD